ncbi:hypothetical protein B0H16DRAFT_152866 [Mycena metata]|uniref:Secreted protein n=1 Tax=Mycena metata TaxID=1033252 RepID=A0AAD7I550_9AGAR|nr:hypothetical protein B0H16DRAFT_152866 [Mycena metata]
MLILAVFQLIFQTPFSTPTRALNSCDPRSSEWKLIATARNILHLEEHSSPALIDGPLLRSGRARDRRCRDGEMETSVQDQNVHK